MSGPVVALSRVFPERGCCKPGTQQNASTRGCSQSPGLSVSSPPLPLRTPSKDRAETPRNHLCEAADSTWRRVRCEPRQRQPLRVPHDGSGSQGPLTSRDPNRVQPLLETLPEKGTLVACSALTPHRWLSLAAPGGSPAPILPAQVLRPRRALCPPASAVPAGALPASCRNTGYPHRPRPRCRRWDGTAGPRFLFGECWLP